MSENEIRQLQADINMLRELVNTAMPHGNSHSVDHGKTIDELQASVDDLKKALSSRDIILKTDVAQSVRADLTRQQNKMRDAIIEVAGAEIGRTRGELRKELKTRVDSSLGETAKEATQLRAIVSQHVETAATLLKNAAFTYAYSEGK